MEQDESLKNEQIERMLSPHPLSFMKLQSLCLFVIIWGILIGWLANFSEHRELLAGNQWYTILVWGMVLLLVGVIAALLTIRWSLFFMYLGIFSLGLFLIWSQDGVGESGVFIPFYSIAISIVGFLMVELYRRSHKYIITNLRIIFSGGVFTKRERTLRYDKISDINTEQGILGQIFGFGTITPVSQSGFGLGSDKSLAAGGLQFGGKKAKFFGLVGGGREVQTPRTRSYYELHGVCPYKEIKKIIEGFVQNSVITAYQQEQVTLQKENINQQKEQIDVQKQMRDLLKKQMSLKEDDD
ncbi:MAG: PH domain-containing protein [Thermoplasmatota archaeon]